MKSFFLWLQCQCFCEKCLTVKIAHTSLTGSSKVVIRDVSPEGIKFCVTKEEESIEINLERMAFNDFNLNLIKAGYTYVAVCQHPVPGLSYIFAQTPSCRITCKSHVTTPRFSQRHCVTTVTYLVFLCVSLFYPQQWLHCVWSVVENILKELLLNLETHYILDLTNRDGQKWEKKYSLT